MLSSPLLPRITWLILAAGLTACGQVDSVAPVDAVPVAESQPSLRAVVATQILTTLEDEDDFLAVAQDFGLTPVSVESSGLALYDGDADLQLLAGDPRVRVAQPNAIADLAMPVSITLGFHEGDWELGPVLRQDALASLYLEQIHRRFRGAGIRVAVLDTGVDPTHPHLVDRLEIDPLNPLGAIDVAEGVDTDGDGVFDEAYGHGTHVAGIIATMAPDATLLPIRVLDSDGVGTAFDIARGLYEAIRQGANILNLSLIIDGDDPDVIHDALRAVEEAGIVIVGAAGNIAGPTLYPASDSHVVGVAAVDDNGVLASFSASEDSRLAAPGISVVSSYPGGERARASGTSMSTAVVSGSLALVAGGLKDLHLAEERLRETATAVVPEDAVRDGNVSPLRALRLPPPGADLTPTQVGGGIPAP